MQNRTGPPAHGIGPRLAGACRPSRIPCWNARPEMPESNCLIRSRFYP
ncbi:hypothetical protein Y88_1486 [Novosphingobium nitrogenifigens DSM 19370]|uniref:Uncharacterized protein n=1 Tax=Novosphingobium nitrogenifigens DSM 19370 TaxID=983920 RepID=F1Z7E3_9SPHN|nr:hypothetical protein Y88_1486 [Novosphingobium nitrogenifigens DSM 19370]